MVGRTGFEPATSGTQNQRSTKLSYPPTERDDFFKAWVFRMQAQNDIFS